MPRLSFVPALVVLLLAVLGCGGDDDSGTAVGGNVTPTPAPSASSEERAYLEELASNMRRFATESAELNDTLARAFDPAESVEARQQAGVAYSVEYEQFTIARRDAIAAIVPPEQMASAHGDLAAAAGEAVTLVQSVRGRMETSPVADSVAYTAIIAEFGGVSVAQHYRDACVDLQRRATALSVEGDFGCN